MQRAFEQGWASCRPAIELRAGCSPCKGSQSADPAPNGCAKLCCWPLNRTKSLAIAPSLWLKWRRMLRGRDLRVRTRVGKPVSAKSSTIDLTIAGRLAAAAAAAGLLATLLLIGP